MIRVDLLPRLADFLHNNERLLLLDHLLDLLR